ncbi:hypothetical protein [Legionella saoudiensis]|uniref:hypothetical protein n=1 Tax=Legionella saoudiensis TaxID=1750561 RepID=UPI00072FDFB6|nr:hypothetical protein [Legionella saoudiensis]
MDKDKNLNKFYHETFKKWLKGKCSPQSNSVSNSFQDEKINAQYDEQQEVFIIGTKEYPRSQVETTIDNEEEFNLLVIDMVHDYQ